jgi:hypothetical protein
MFETAGGMLVRTAYNGSKYWNCCFHLFCCYVTGFAPKNRKSIRELEKLKNKK